MLALVAVVLAAPGARARAEEALPLEAEAPPELGALPGRTGLSLGGGLDGEGWRPARLGASLALGSWRLGLAGTQGQGRPRGALAAGEGRWRLVAGGLGGDWGSGLLLGRRGRAGLGNPRPPSARWLPLAPSTQRSPLAAGLYLAHAGRSRVAVAVLAPAAVGEAPRGLLGLGWRALSLDLLAAPAAPGLAAGLALPRREGSAGLQIEAGLLAPPAAPLRRALAWRLALAPATSARGLALGVEGLLLGGPQPRPAPSGWLGGAPGEELHAALALTGPGDWHWRLARRLRQGLGLAPGLRRSESALCLEQTGRLAPLRLALELRQVEERRTEAIPAAPGFPRAVSRLALRQELAVNLESAGGRALAWRRRFGEQGVGSLFQLRAPLPGLPRLRLSLLRHELEPGAPAFLVASGSDAAPGLAAESETRALAGSGWQLAARLPVGSAGRRLLLSARGARRDDGRLSGALWVDLALARSAQARD
ncbi:hypothetical protein FJ251_01935 [bacterium]|nr:hypothetical protein [bacterium]